MKKYVIVKARFSYGVEVFKRVCKWLPLYRKVSKRPFAKRVGAIEYIKSSLIERYDVEISSSRWDRKWLWLKK